MKKLWATFLTGSDDEKCIMSHDEDFITKMTHILKFEMLKKDDVILVIRKKIDEHFVSMEEVNTELKSLKKEKTLESASKHMVLKDKAMFHKACVLVLNDVLKEIE
jgi:hypothetical protein